MKLRDLLETLEQSLNKHRNSQIKLVNVKRKKKKKCSVCGKRDKTVQLESGRTYDKEYFCSECYNQDD